MVQFWIELDSCLILWKKPRSLVSQTVRIPVSHWCFLRLQSTFFPSIDLEYVFWPFEYCWMLQSVLECVALSLPSLLRSNQSWIALIAPYCMKFLWAVCGMVPLGGSIPSKDPLWPSALFSNSLCMFELLCCAWWCCSEVEARNQGLSWIIKDLRTPNVDGFAWSWGTFSCTVFWCNYPVWLGNT